MKVRLTQPWKVWSTGHVFPDMPDNLAMELFRLHRAELVTDEPRQRGKSAGLRAGRDYVTR